MASVVDTALENQQQNLLVENGAPFLLPTVHFTNDGWGPSVLPPQYAGLPFACFNRSDRLGKCADFGGYLRFQSRNRFARGEENVELNYRYDEGEAREFSLVDSSKGPRRVGMGGGFNNRGGGGGGRGGNFGGGRGGGGGGRGNAWRATSSPGVGGAGTRGYDDRGALAAGRSGAKGGVARGRFDGSKQRGNRRGPSGGGGSGGNMGGGFAGPQAARREDSVKAEADWILVDSFNLPELNKLSSNVPPASDLRWAGTLETYDEDYDRVTTKLPRKLRRFEELDFAFKTAREDPIMEELAQNDTGNVFVTDAVLSHLMVATRTVAPWDIIVTCLPGGIMFLDARDALEFELHTVNETAHAPPPEGDEINSRVSLSIEASAIHSNFTQQVLARGTAKGNDLPELAPNPFQADDGRPSAAMAYRYRKWNLTNDTSVVVRTTVHAVAPQKATAGASRKYISLWTLNEWDPKLSGVPEYKKTLDAQRGNVVMSEAKNNGARLAKFVVSTLLSGTDSLRLGFISRAMRSDADNHVIVGVMPMVPSQLAKQLEVTEANMWGIVRWLVDLVRKHAKNLQEDTPDEDYAAKFVLVREAGAPKLNLFAVPFESFGEEDEEEEEEDGEEGEDDGGDIDEEEDIGTHAVNLSNGIEHTA